MVAPGQSLNLTEFAPPACHQGHPLGPGKILVGWRPCTCLATREAGTRGHTTVRCLDCHVDGTDTVYCDPLCEARPA